MQTPPNQLLILRSSHFPEDFLPHLIRKSNVVPLRLLLELLEDRSDVCFLLVSTPNEEQVYEIGLNRFKTNSLCVSVCMPGHSPVVTCLQRATEICLGPNCCSQTMLLHCLNKILSVYGSWRSEL